MVKYSSHNEANSVICLNGGTEKDSVSSTIASDTEIAIIGNTSAGAFTI